MAKITLGNNLTIDRLIELADSNDVDGYLTNSGPDGFTFYNPVNGFSITVTGSNMTYGEEDFWNGGVATGMYWKLGSEVLFSIDGMLLDGAAASRFDTGYAAELPGFASEVAFWLRGDDELNAGEGNDLLRGYEGNDRLNGGAGIDAAVYNGLQTAYKVSKELGGGAFTVSSVAEGVDTLFNIENIVFGTQVLALREATETARYLQGKFGLHIDDAAKWVVDHMDRPQEIQQICAAGAVSADMLAEVVEPWLPGIQVTGSVVNAWFNHHGMDGLLL